MVKLKQIIKPNPKCPNCSKYLNRVADYPTISIKGFFTTQTEYGFTYRCSNCGSEYEKE